MLCKSFSELLPIEQRNLIGAVVHCVMNDEVFFQQAQNMIKKADKQGLFEGVKFNPQPTETENIPDRLKNQ